MSLPFADPAQIGIDPGAVEAFAQAVEQQGLGLHALTVARHGRIGAQANWEPYQLDIPHMLFSASKSFTSTAIGLAQDEGLLNIDEPVIDFFPEHATSWAVKNTQGLLVRHLLSMSTGHAIDTLGPMGALPFDDWVRLFLESPLVYPAGTHFLYNSGATYILGEILRRRCGQGLNDYLTPRLFEPLGIKDHAWEKAPSGQELGASGLRLTTEDLASLGQLYLDGGLWQGRQLLSPDWARAATSTQIATSSDNPDAAPDWNQGFGAGDWAQGYCFQFWTSHDGSFRADGAFGQFSLVLPAQDAVIALSCGTTRTQEVLDTVWGYLVPGLGDQAAGGKPSEGNSQADGPTAGGAAGTTDGRRADDGGQAAPLRLRRQLPGDVLRPASPSRLIPPGDHQLPFLRVGAAQLAVEGDDLILTDRQGHCERHPIGLGQDWGPESVSHLWPHEEMSQVRMRSRGGFLPDGRYEIIQQCIQTPFARIWRFRPDSDHQGLFGEVCIQPGYWDTREEYFTL